MVPDGLWVDRIRKRGAWLSTLIVNVFSCLQILRENLIEFLVFVSRETQTYRYVSDLHKQNDTNMAAMAKQHYYLVTVVLVQAQ